MKNILRNWKGFLPSDDNSESSDAIENACGPITQEEAAIAYGILLFLGAIFIIVKIYKAKRSAAKGVQQAADVMVFPMYFTFLKWNVAVFITRAVMIVLVPHGNPLYGAAYLGLLTGFTAALREGIVLFFVQKSAGRSSVMKSCVFGSVWGLILATLGASFYFEHHADRDGDEDMTTSEENDLNDIFPEYLGTSLLYFLLYDGLVFVFHLVAVLYMSIHRYLHHKQYSQKNGKKFNIKNAPYTMTPSRFSNMHLFYSGLNVFVFGVFAASDVLAMLSSTDQIISGCLAISGQFVDYSIYVVVLYYVLLYDSYYWRKLKPRMPNQKTYLGFTPIGMNINSEEHNNIGEASYYRDASRSGSDYDEDDEDNINKPFLSKSLLEREIRSGMRQYNKPQQRLSNNNSLTVGSWVEPTPNEKAQVWIDFSRIRFGKVIGEGSTARVYEGFLDNKPVALKLIRCDNVDQELIREIVREVAITNSLKHPNIIHLYGVSLWLPDIVMVLEYAQRGSLFFLLPSVKLFSLKDKIKLCLDVVKAIHFLHYHEPALIHLDIKSLNLLVDKDWNIKLGDFGESRSLNYRLSKGHRGTFEPRGTARSDTTSPRATFLSADSDTEEPIIGTVQWLAPEAISHRQYSDKTDIYAAGVVINEIMSGLPPFYDKKAQELPLLIVEKKLRPTIPADCPASVKSIIEMCWSENPSARPTAIELLGMLRAVGDSSPVQNMRSTSESWKILDSII